MAFYKTDDVTRWIQFTNITDNRDKLNKLVQYGLKYLAWVFEEYPLYYNNFSSVSQNFSNARKIFRLGKFINEYQKLKDIIYNPINKDRFQHIMTIIIRASYFAYWIFDGLFILVRAKLFTGNSKNISKKAFYFWFIGVFFSIILECYQLAHCTFRYVQLKKQYMTSLTSLISHTTELHLLQKERCSHVLNIIKQCGDCLSASNGIELPKKIYGKNFSDGVIGIAGVISAFISCYQQYPE